YFSFSLLLPIPPRSTLFPYTTLFRSSSWLSARIPFASQIQRVVPPGPFHRRSVGILSQSGRGWTSTLFMSRSTPLPPSDSVGSRSEEHTSELQSRFDLVCRLLLEKKN